MSGGGTVSKSYINIQNLNTVSAVNSNNNLNNNIFDKSKEV